MFLLGAWLVVALASSDWLVGGAVGMTGSSGGLKIICLIRSLVTRSDSNLFSIFSMIDVVCCLSFVVIIPICSSEGAKVVWRTESMYQSP